MKIYLNGKLVDKDKAVVSVFDHGLLYGDGVFEGIRTYDNLVFRLKEHIDRLYRSADAIGLKVPMTKSEMIEVHVWPVLVDRHSVGANVAGSQVPVTSCSS